MAMVTVLAPGCLVKDVIHTVYLEPDGSVTWMVLERDVRSDADSAQDRAREESDFINAAATDRLPASLAFSQLESTDVHTTILRSARPYSVLTEARFAQFDALMGAFASRLDRQAESTFERHNGEVTWTLTVPPDSSSPDSRPSSGDEDINALIDVFDGGRFVLVTGRFTSAVGFELSEDKRAATLRVPDDSQIARGAEPLRFSLTWSEEAR